MIEIKDIDFPIHTFVIFVFMMFGSVMSMLYDNFVNKHIYFEGFVLLQITLFIFLLVGVCWSLIKQDIFMMD